MEEHPRTVFIIGASGAIGRRLVAYLCANNVRVIAAIRKTELPSSLSEYIHGGLLLQQFDVDVRDESTLDKAFATHPTIDAVWMLAAPLSIESARNPEKAEDVVIGGLRRLLSVMGRCGVHRICFSDSIGSYGSDAPRIGCTARWLIDHPEQDPGSVYGSQKRKCRHMMKKWVDENEQRSSRFAIIPGVLHTDDSWGDGTTEYVLEALKAAAYGTKYVCPIALDQTLPMVMRDDLVHGLYFLTFASESQIQEPQGGYAIAGLSFTPKELFREIHKIVPTFVWEIDENAASNPANIFASLWPDALSKIEAARDLEFLAQTISLSTIIRKILDAWRKRRVVVEQEDGEIESESKM